MSNPRRLLLIGGVLLMVAGMTLAMGPYFSAFQRVNVAAAPQPSELANGLQVASLHFPLGLGLVFAGAVCVLVTVLGRRA